MYKNPPFGSVRSFVSPTRSLFISASALASRAPCAETGHACCPLAGKQGTAWLYFTPRRAGGNGVGYESLAEIRFGFFLMFKKQTLFIVGAGGSEEVGLPLGGTLPGQIAAKMDI